MPARGWQLSVPPLEERLLHVCEFPSWVQLERRGHAVQYVSDSRHNFNLSMPHCLTVCTTLLSALPHRLYYLIVCASSLTVLPHCLYCLYSLTACITSLPNDGWCYWHQRSTHRQSLTNRRRRECVELDALSLWRAPRYTHRGEPQRGDTNAFSVVWRRVIF